MTTTGRPVVEEHKPRAVVSLGYSRDEISLFSDWWPNEYKQTGLPVLRVTSRAFGIGRRMPIVNHYPE
jgi:hypothetical protein